MIDLILYIQCDLSSVPLECSTAATVTSPFPPTPGHYHVPYRKQGEPRVGWHGETYCLVSGCRSFGDAPLPTGAKVKAGMPGPRGARKRHYPVEWSNKDLGCSSPKIPRLEHDSKRLTPQKLTPEKMEVEKPDPRPALKRHHPVEKLNENLGCSSPKIQRLDYGGGRLSPLKLAG
ncbi:DPEP2 neighbor protein [Pipistrellus kuhlii]|uniref:DPEP2 neighbor n=1 Tax=Pipistrellus kuhlii TaxID=59472 RepID=A0A7J7UZV5_PIPKU|nr:DPEP2 neighbor protein [Pipistrellus kuhlii]KAF6318409.1 DPEP2 neighbor [Pipistrellus kuhlii]